MLDFSIMTSAQAVHLDDNGRVAITIDLHADYEEEDAIVIDEHMTIRPRPRIGATGADVSIRELIRACDCSTDFRDRKWTRGIGKLRRAINDVINTEKVLSALQNAQHEATGSPRSNRVLNGGEHTEMVHITFTQIMNAMQDKARAACTGMANCPDHEDPGSSEEHLQAIARYSRLYEECAQEYCEIHGLTYEASLTDPIVIEGPAETAEDVLADISDLFDAKIGKY